MLSIHRTICTLCSYTSRSLSSKTHVKPKFDFELMPEVKKAVEEGTLKSRHHPGILNVGTIGLPNHLHEAALTLLREYPEKNLMKDGEKLSNYLWSRHTPAEAEELSQMKASVEAAVIQKENFDPMSPEIPEEYRKHLLTLRMNKVHQRLKQVVYHWKPVSYNQYMSSVYLLARLAPDFAALVWILREMRRRDPNFSPLTMLDFGSGVGSGMWAVDEVWREACKEVVCVDASADMNSLADRLLRGGHPDSPRKVREAGTFFKQFLPQSDTLKYSIVLSSRSLFELPNMESRLKTVDILWRKTSGYLVIVEAGTNAGYKLVQEARDYVLSLCQQAREKGEAHAEGYVFSPCPHDNFCPRFFDGTNIPCNFSVTYRPFTFGNHKIPSKDLFSYIVLRRGTREGNSEEKWPRLVQEPLMRTRHIICRTCTSYGKLQELTVTKRRHGSECYRVCKNSRWGDLLPVIVPDRNHTRESDFHDSDETNETKSHH